MMAKKKAAKRRASSDAERVKKSAKGLSRSSSTPIKHGTLVTELSERLLPQPVRVEPQPGGALTLVGGEPREVVVQITGSLVSVSLFAVEWEGPHLPAVRPQLLGELNWHRLPAAGTIAALQALIKAASDLRNAKYRKCEKCGAENPPEWMHSKTVCSHCAEEHFGVVY